MYKPKVLILHVSGTNRDLEAAKAIELAGGQPEILHINELKNSDLAAEKKLEHYQMLILAGGFSYGDALGAGKRLALDLQLDLAENLAAFIESGKPVLGICNGFQALAKANLLINKKITLTHNLNAKFECRWVTLQPNPNSTCVFTKHLTEPIYCPVAHGEGRFLSQEPLPEKHIALRYTDTNGKFATNVYPLNPNGSQADIAGICNDKGNMLGLMPHPEDHIFNWQHPLWARGEKGFMGLPLFEAGVNYASQFL